MKVSINDRIEMLVNEYFNGNKAAFENAVGLKPSVLSSYIGKRQSKPNVDMVTKIITRLGIDARWLLTGEETPKQEHYKQYGDRSVMAKTIHSLNVDQRNIGEEAKVDEHIAVSEELVLPSDCPDEMRHSVHNLQLQVDLLNRLVIEKDERIAELKERIEELKIKIDN